VNQFGGYRELTLTGYRNHIDDIAKEVGSPVGGQSHLLLNGKAQEAKSAENGKRMVATHDPAGHSSQINQQRLAGTT
jgi:hypothetical protein